MKLLLLLSIIAIVALFTNNALSADTQPPEILPLSWEESFECSPWSVSRHALPGNCTSYLFCFAGSQQVRECGSGLHFDQWTQQCTFPERARCTRDLCPPTNDINNIIYFPSETHCEEYYMCIDGSLQTFRCDWGIHWDQSTKRCERPEIAQCQIISTTTTWAPWEHNQSHLA